MLKNIWDLLKSYVYTIFHFVQHYSKYCLFWEYISGLSRSSSYSGNKPLIVGRWMNIQPPPDVILSNSIDVGARAITSEPTPVSDKPSISLRFANQFMSENSMPSPSPRLATNEETRSGSVQDKSNQIVFPSDPILSLQPLSFNQKSRSTTTSDTSSSPTTPPGVFTPNPNLESIDRSIDNLESQLNRTLNSEKDEESKLPELNYSTPSFPTPSSVTRPSLSEISGYPYLRSIAPRPTQPSDSSSERLEQTTSGLPTQDTTDNSSTTSTTTTTTTTTTTITTPTTTTTTTTTTTQPPSTQKPVGTVYKYFRERFSMFLSCLKFVCVNLLFLLVFVLLMLIISLTAQYTKTPWFGSCITGTSPECAVFFYHVEIPC